MGLITRFWLTTSLVLLSLSVILAFPTEKVKPAVPEPKPEQPMPYPYPYTRQEYKPNPEVKKEAALPISLEGLILCRSGSEYHPIQGAVARVTCQAVEANGQKVPFTIYTAPTDAKGYFFVEFCPVELTKGLRITECRVYLEKSPLETCNVPTNVNNGITGALLSSYRILNEKQMKLFSVRPFFYTNDPKSVPSNGY